MFHAFILIFAEPDEMILPSCFPIIQRLQLSKPQLEASWTEQILVTPIKPRQFPHTVMPLSRPRSAEIMTR